MSWAVLGKLSGRGVPSFTTTSSLAKATPRYTPLLSLPFPAAMEATAVPWPLTSREGTRSSARLRLPDASASLISSRVYTLP